MSLSAGEQQAFEELVGRFVDDGRRRRSRIALAAAVAGFTVNLLALLATLAASVWLAAAAYGLMFGSLVVAERALRSLSPLWWERPLRRLTRHGRPGRGPGRRHPA